MWEASEKLEFEKASQVRDKLFEIKKDPGRAEGNPSIPWGYGRFFQLNLMMS